MKAFKNLLLTVGLVLAGLLCVNWQGTSTNTLETTPTPSNVPEYALAGETSGASGVRGALRASGSAALGIHAGLCAGNG